MIRLILIAALVFTSFFSLGQNDWTKKASFSGYKAERAVGFAIAGNGYICAGQDTGNIVRNDLWQYSPASNSWAQKANLPGVGRRNAVAFTINNKGYVGTGMSAAESSLGSTLNDFWEYNPATNSWEQIANYPGGSGNGIYFATAFSIDSKGYVCCGKIGASNYAKDLWEYKPSVDQWIQRANFGGGDRYQLVSFVVDDKAYVGLGTDYDAYTNDLWEFNPSTNFWTQKNNFPGAERSAASAFGIQQRGYLGLGGDGGYLDDFWEYNPYSDSWLAREEFPGGERRNAISFVIGDRGYIGTGKGYSGLRRSMYEYTPLVVGMKENNKATFYVYPNPTTGFVAVETQHSFVLSIMDNLGRIVKEISVPNGNTTIDVSNFSSGVYQLIGFKENGERFTKQLVIRN